MNATIFMKWPTKGTGNVNASPRAEGSPAMAIVLESSDVVKALGPLQNRRGKKKNEKVWIVQTAERY